MGFVGVVLFIAATGVIAANWDALRDAHDWRADVVVHETGFAARQGAVAPSGSAQEAFLMDHGNVFRVAARVTWTETGSGTERYEVRAALVAPNGTAVATDLRAGGVAGITLQADLLDVPAPTRYAGTEASAQARADREYPVHEDGRGTWRVTLATDSPSRVGGAGIEYVLGFDASWYEVVLRRQVDGPAA